MSVIHSEFVIFSYSQDYTLDIPLIFHFFTLTIRIPPATMSSRGDTMEKSNYHLNKTFFKNPLQYDGLSVVQIGRMFCKSTTVINTHMHFNRYELTVVSDGEGLIYTNGVPTRVKKGDIYLSMPCDAHKIETDPEKLLKFDFFAFVVDGSSLAQEFEKQAQNYTSPNTRVFRDDRIRPLINNAIAELSEGEIYKNELLTCLFRQILIYTFRGFRGKKPERHASEGSNAEVLCHRLMNYIDTHIFTMKNLQELSGATDYSYGYLSVLFKSTTSITLSAYFQEKKLDTARMLLLDNKLTVTETAEMLNYSSVYAFSKAFRSYYGVSPRKFIKDADS